jgi:hypothetical protein
MVTSFVLRGGGEAPRVVEERHHGRGPLQLVDRRVLHVARDGGERPLGREVDDVAGQERRVLRLVAAKEQVVEVELGHHLRAALQLDRTHRARGRGPARGEHGVHEGGKRAHRVGAGARGAPDHEDLDGAELAERDEQLEVAEVPRHRLLDQRREVGVPDPRHGDRAHARDRDHAVAVHDGPVVDVDLPPGADHELVAGADEVVGRHRHVLHRREGGRSREEVVAVERQPLADGAVDEFLEVVRPGGGGRGGRDGGARRLGAPALLGRHELEQARLLARVGDHRRLHRLHDGGRRRVGPGLRERGREREAKGDENGAAHGPHPEGHKNAGDSSSKPGGAPSHGPVLRRSGRTRPHSRHSTGLSSSGASFNSAAFPCRARLRHPGPRWSASRQAAFSSRGRSRAKYSARQAA